MCKAVSEGGQRCAAHTRPRYEQTPVLDPSWLKYASEYASTPEGHARLTREADEAETPADHERQAALRSALARGETLRIVADETAWRVADATQRGKGLRQQDIDRVIQQFGVAEEQVRRDHAISHILAALTTMPGSDGLTFFGGTALSRTYLPTLRLSEDIHLITTNDRTATAEQIEQTLNRALHRTHGRVNWQPNLTQVREAEPAVIRTDGGITVRIQLLTAGGYPNWPTSPHDLIQRYQDAPPARLTTYSPAAFAASKLNAWHDRHAPRDLYDMWALARHRYITPEAAELFKRHGSAGGLPDDWMFTTLPTAEQWHAALSHQGRIAATPEQAISVVTNAWRSAISNSTT